MMRITKRLIFSGIILSIIAGFLLSGCSKDESSAEPSGFDLAGESLLFKGDENGKGTLYSGSTKVYDGEFVGGIIQGHGKLYADGKLRYEGQFQNNQALGNGILYNSSGKKMFEGSISQNDGTTYYATGYLFTEDGKQNFYGDLTVTGDTVAYGNTGMLFYPSGEIFYLGGFQNGVPDGTGTYYDEEGNTLEIK